MPWNGHWASRFPRRSARLRRLLYCGEWIESHALHVHLLHAPDFLGYESGLSMAQDHPEEVNRGLQMKRVGNQLLEVLAGRPIHPINVAIGGFYRFPRHDELAALIPQLEWALEAAVATTRWVAGFDFPDFQRTYDMVSLVHPDEYPMNEGQIGSTTGATIDVTDFQQEFVERQVPHSTALQAVRTSTNLPYLVGPLARVNLNLERLSPTARRVLGELRIAWPCHNIFQSIVARGLELIHAFEEALQIIRVYRPTGLPRVSYEHRSGLGCAATEAPRGLLYHRFAIDAQGLVTQGVIIPPTSQNQGQIEDDVRVFVPGIAAREDETMTLRCEHLIRSYDPCISCATHFLKLQVQRV